MSACDVLELICLLVSATGWTQDIAGTEVQSSLTAMQMYPGRLRRRAIDDESYQPPTQHTLVAHKKAHLPFSSRRCGGVGRSLLVLAYAVT
jgi:hypothetical protein